MDVYSLEKIGNIIKENNPIKSRLLFGKRLIFFYQKNLFTKCYKCSIITNVKKGEKMESFEEDKENDEEMEMNTFDLVKKINGIMLICIPCVIIATIVFVIVKNL